MSIEMQHNEEVIRVATFNVHRLEHFDGIEKLMIDNCIDVCALQEVNGIRPLRSALSDQWECLFDFSYPNYGNGLIFRRDKFKVIHQATHQLKGTPGKKTAFEVWLTFNKKASTHILKLFGTHLDYKTEEERMREIIQLQRFLPTHESHILLGDFNSLNRSDYSEIDWKAITDVRQLNKWESPKSDVVTVVLGMGYNDVLSDSGQVVPTCRFNTRVDYIFTKDMKHIRSFVADSQGTSDHKLVIVDLPQ